MMKIPKTKDEAGLLPIRGLSSLGIGLMTCLGLGADNVSIGKPGEKERDHFFAIWWTCPIMER